MNDLFDLLRAKVGETNQTIVAGELGITQPMLSMILSGKRKPGLKTLIGIGSAYPDLSEVAVAHVFGPVRSSWRTTAR